MSGLFGNPHYSPTPPPGETFWGGMPTPNTQGRPDGAHPGHGHGTRLPVADFLGNVGLTGADVRIPGVPRPRW